MSVLNDIKAQFHLKNNALIKIILINVLIYALDCIVWVISKISTQDVWFHTLQSVQGASSNLNEIAYKPWTLLTYAFSHDTPSPFHIFFNMLGLYWFGGLISEYIGSRRLVSLYIIGALAGVLLYLICYNFIPFYAERPPSLLIGASGSVLATVVAAATLIPTYRFHLIFIGPVKIVYIAAFYVFISFIGTVQGNAGGNLAHLGGAFAGYIFIVSLNRGYDIGKPINASIQFIESLFSKNKKVRLSYSNNKTDPQKSGNVPNQKDIDAILDKISRSGYESLTKDEKQKLFKASQ